MEREEGVKGRSQNWSDEGIGNRDNNAGWKTNLKMNKKVSTIKSFETPEEEIVRKTTYNVLDDPSRRQKRSLMSPSRVPSRSEPHEIKRKNSVGNWVIYRKDSRGQLQEVCFLNVTRSNQNQLSNAGHGTVRMKDSKSESDPLSASDDK